SDYDECAVYGSCSQTCMNTYGSYGCSCTEGYVMQSDRKSCKAKIEPTDRPPVLLIVSSEGIAATYLNGTTVPTQNSLHSNGALTLDFNYDEESVCWVTAVESTSQLRCAKMTKLKGFSEEREIRTAQNLHNVEQMAIDWLSGNFYFVDRISDRIFVCNQNEDACITLIDLDLHNPKGIALDPLVGVCRQPTASFHTADSPCSHNVGRQHNSGQLTGKPPTPTVGNRIAWTRTDDVQSPCVVPLPDAPHGSPPHNYCFEIQLLLGSSPKSLVVIFLWCGHSPRCKEAIVLLSARRCSHDGVIASSCDSLNGHQRTQSPRGFWCLCVYSLGASAPLTLQSFDALTLCCLPAPMSNFHPCTSCRQNLPPQASHPVPAPSSPPAPAPEQTLTSPLVAPGGSEQDMVMSEGEQDALSIAAFWDEVSFLRAETQDPDLTQLFFTDYGNAAKVERCNMDGTNRMRIVDFKTEQPTAIALDLVKKLVYWADVYLDYIEVVDYDGKNRHTVIQGENVKYLYGLTVFEDYLYASSYDISRGSKVDILKINRFNSTVLVNLTTMENARSIHVYHKLTQPTVRSHACEADPYGISGGCSHICLLSGSYKSRTCRCRPGFILGNDGKSCKKPKTELFLFYGKGRPGIIRGMDLNTKSADEYMIQIENLVNPRALDFHAEANYIYFADTTSFLIGRQKIDGTGRETILKDGECIGNPFLMISTLQPKTCFLCFNQVVYNGKELNHPFGISHYRNYIFWTDYMNGSIFQLDLLTKNVTLLRSESPPLFVLRVYDAQNQQGDNACRVNYGGCSTLCLAIPGGRVCACADNQHMENNNVTCSTQTCQPNQYSCGNGRCIPQTWLCDRDDDCGDKSDEAPSCDDDCGDGSDEAGCVRSCSNIQFQCSSGRCIPDHWACDGDNDCGDFSDETNATCTGDGKCISKNWVCDGDNDCEDLSDEESCENVACRPPKYPCANDTTICLQPEKICSGTIDCPDGSDEGPLCDPFEAFIIFSIRHEIRRIDLHKRDYSLLVPGLRNTIALDFHFNQSLLYWTDVVEDKIYRGKLADTGDPFEAFIIFSIRHEIRRIDLHKRDYSLLVPGLRNTIALDFHFNQSLLYWTDVVEDKIYRGKLADAGGVTGIEVVVQHGLATPEGLAVDWIAGNFYWIDSNLDQIEVAKLDGTMRTTLIAGAMEHPRAIALDPQHGILFWTDWDAIFPRIEAASMSGAGRHVIFKDMEIGAWPNGLTVDHLESRIVWTDARSDAIYSALYDGTARIEILRGHEYLSHPFAVSLFGGNVYWTDWRTNTLAKANKWTGHNVTVIQKTSAQPFDLQIYHPSRQPQEVKSFLLYARHSEIRGVDIDNPYLNIITAFTVPDIDDVTVVDYEALEERIYWTDVKTQTIKRAFVNGTGLETIISGDILNVRGLALDWISRNMYWLSSEYDETQINIARLDGSLKTTVIHGIDKPKCLVVHPSKGKLYWTDGNTINMANMDGSNSKILHQNQKDPVGLSIDYAANMLYWISSGNRTINRCNLDGSNLEIMESMKKELTKATALAVMGDKLWWADENSAQFGTVNKKDGRNPVVLRNKTAGVVHIKVYDKDGQKGRNPCQLNNGGCSQLCLPTSENTRTCSCTVGYDLRNDRMSCEGRNPCQLNNGGCSQLCLPTSENTRTCSCTVGYDLRNDRLSCEGIGSFLMYSIHEGIRGISLDPSDSTETLMPITGTLFAVGVDFHAENDTIYWTDMGLNRISRAKRDQTWKEDIITNGVGRVEGIAVDWIAGNIYWTDHGFNLIEVARLNGSFRSVVLSDGLDQPRAIAVHPEKGYMFWTEWGQTPCIGRARLDGSEQVIFISSGIAWPNGISIDYEIREWPTEVSFKIAFQENTLYWCDARTDKIERINLESGESREIVLSGSNVDMFSVAVFGVYIYWSDRAHANGSIRRGFKSDATDALTIRSGLGINLKDVKVFNRAQEKGTNPCAKNNGGCQQLCFYLGNGQRTCACAHGYLSEDGLHCQNYDGYLLYSERTILKSIHLSDETNLNSPIKPCENPAYFKNVIALAFDYSQRVKGTNRIFFSDVHFGNIQVINDDWTGRRIIIEMLFCIPQMALCVRGLLASDGKQSHGEYQRYGTTLQTVALADVGSVEGLAYHRAWDTLYWTSSTTSTITRHTIDLTRPGAFSREAVITMSEEDHPHVLALDECQNLMFWTNWNEQHPSIMRATLAGNNIQVIVKSGPGTFFGLAIYGDFIFWSDWVRRAILRSNKYTGGEMKVLRADIPHQPMGIVAVANDTNSCELSPCKVINGGCDDLCVLTPDGRVNCTCRGERILLDANRCVSKNSSCSIHTEFECGNGECIDYQLTCDGIAHCKDKSDEKMQYCDNRNCRKGFKRCYNQRCVANSRFCDGLDDCGDNSDEVNCNNSTCNSSEFRCQDGTCIANSAWCNQIIDCTDASDEKNCNNTECLEFYKLGVKATGFISCNSTSLCILPTWVCDGSNDCGDYADETNCQVSHSHQCEDGYFACPSGNCISSVWLCDGQKDCEDGADEYQCDSSCLWNQFACSKDKCIAKQWVCDGEDDCGNGLDESEELCAPNTTCDENAFLCRNKACIPKQFVCDHDNDCEDGSDESPECESLCNGSFFMCANGRCIPVGGLCNKADDCGDGSDERNCNVNECLNRRISGCSQECQDLPLGYKALNNVIAIDFDYRKEFIYWIDSSRPNGRRINRMRLNGSDLKIVHRTAVPSALAVDWIGKNLYWCDTERKSVEVSKVNGLYPTILVSSGLKNPKDLALDTQAGYVYWIDCCESPHIGRVGMDGTYQSVVVDTEVSRPVALTIDYINRRLYWADENHILFSDMDGSNRQKVPNQDIQGVIGLTVFEDYLYWTDGKSKSINRAHKTSGAERMSLLNSWLAITDIQVYHPFRQPDVPKHPCQVNNGGCSHLCLLSPGGGYKCACPTNFYLAADHKTCLSNCTASQIVHRTAVPSALAVDWIGKNLYWCDTERKSVEVSKVNGLYPTILVSSGLKNPKDLALDTQAGYVYWIDCCESPHIGRVGMDGTYQSVVVDTEVSRPVALTIDYINRRLYWADENHILFSNMDGSNRQKDTYVCLSGQFKCTKKQKCIPLNLRCNGQDDCGDGEDEMDCPDSTCSPDQFQCKTTKHCISKLWVCDEDPDCADGSDEASCADSTCSPDQFQCKTTKHCISKLWVCDEDPDCADGSDEASCDEKTCGPHEFHCQNNNCIPDHWRCDSQNDCGDNSDEENCNPSTCNSKDFVCANGDCVSARFRCDGDYDCVDSSDEKGCETRCSQDQFQCLNSHCISLKWLCDGQEDCKAGEDEENCDKVVIPSCSSKEYVCSSGGCVAASLRCNGIDDCADGSDEVGCVTDCREDEFRCQNRAHCIPARWRCDGVHDCVDHSDEENCDHDGYTCRADEFVCNNTLCKLHVWVCDGEDDCGDNSDEDPEMCAKFPCPPTRPYRCRNDRVCLRSEHICNGVDDCGDGSDEEQCAPSKDMCEGKINPCGEDAVCNQTKTAAVCRCKPGFQRNQKDKQCKEINECLQIGSCSHYCTNTKGSFKCACDRNYREINGTCKAKGLAVDYFNQRLYWADSELSVIGSLRFDGSDSLVAISSKHEINECLQIGSCSHYCTNTKGSFKCACDRNYREINGTCKAKVEYIDSGLEKATSVLVSHRYKQPDRPEDQVLYIANDTEIRGFVYPFNQNHGHKQLARIEDNARIIGMDALYQGHKIIWGTQFNPVSNPCLKKNCEFLCLLNPNGASCSCPEGKVLINGTCGDTSISGDLCRPACENGGRCIRNENGEMRCYCWPNFSGENCEINHCKDYCQNGVTCTGSPSGKPTCRCTLGFTGPNCERRMCDNFCLNGGTCDISQGNQPLCRCPADYTGDRCQYHVCHHYCMNSEACTISNDGLVECVCPPRYEGSLCELDKCVRCLGGLCIIDPNTGDVACNCTNGRVASSCQLCDGYCYNSGTCQLDSENNMPFCHCTAEFKNQRCDEKVNPCDYYCQNEGICILTAFNEPRCKGKRVQRQPVTNGGINVEIGNPSYNMYEVEHDNHEDAGDILRPNFTLDPHKASSIPPMNYANPMYAKLYLDGQNCRKTLSHVDERKELLPKKLEGTIRETAA
ncbi:UNVERIFIED_CONTAM: hypothetical protein FKN15_051430, partial [Acipenser sinensis]